MCGISIQLNVNSMACHSASRFILSEIMRLTTNSKSKVHRQSIVDHMKKWLDW